MIIGRRQMYFLQYACRKPSDSDNYGSLERVLAEFLHCINHGEYIFGGHVIHHRVYSADHAAAAGPENLNYAFHFLAFVAAVYLILVGI